MAYGLFAALSALGGVPGGYKKGQDSQLEGLQIDDAKADALGIKAFGNMAANADALKLMGQGGGGMTGGLGPPGGVPAPQGMSGAPPAPQPPPPGQASQPSPGGPPGPPRPQFPSPGPPGSAPPNQGPAPMNPGGPPQQPWMGNPSQQALGAPQAPPMRPGMPPMGMQGPGAAQGGPPGGPPGMAPRPQGGPVPAPGPQPPQMGGQPGMPQPGSMSFMQAAQMLKQANPDIKPEVMAHALKFMMPMMTQQGRMDYQMATLQMKEQQLQVREQQLHDQMVIAGMKDDTTRRGQDIGLEGKREGYDAAQTRTETTQAGANARQADKLAASREIAEMKDETINRIAGNNQNLRRDLESQREQARAELAKSNQAAAQTRTETVVGARAAEGAANRELRGSEGDKNREVKTGEGAANRASREGIAAGSQAGQTERKGMDIASRKELATLSADTKTKLAGASNELKEKMQAYAEAGKYTRAAMQGQLKSELQRQGFDEKQRLEIMKAADAMQRVETQQKGATDRTKMTTESAERRTNMGISGRAAAAATKAESDKSKGLQPDQKAALVDAIGQYKQTPYTSAARGPGAEIMAEVHKKYPDWNQQEWTTRNKAATAFTTGKQADTVRSLGTAYRHLDTLLGMSKALGSGDAPIFNSLAQFFANQTGEPAPKTFDAAKQIVASEVIKAVSGIQGGGQKERLEAAANMVRTASPKQIEGVINGLRDLLKGQVKGFQMQYENGTKLKDFDDRFGFSAPPTLPGGGMAGVTSSGVHYEVH